MEKNPAEQPIKRKFGTVRVLVATTAMLSFISFWRAAAIVLNDLASSAYYAGGISEHAIGKAAPWFILAIMLFSYAVRAIYIESCSMFVRGGVYRVVKESLGGTLAKFSVAALMFDYILTGPISGVSAGQYLAGFLNTLFHYLNVNVIFPTDTIAVIFAIIVTIFFWWQNTKGIPESSRKALSIMKLTTTMVVILVGWSIYTLIVKGGHLPPWPLPENLHFADEALGWLKGSRWPTMFGILGIFIALGHSVLAMSGEESLAQVYREIEHPKLRNLKKAGFVIFIYSLVFTSLVSFFAVMIIPDDVRLSVYGDNLISGLAMNMVGPNFLRLIFQAFVVLVGAMILSGAVNTAIIGSNGVLNRVSEDGILADWFRRPHPRFGTSYRIINLVVIAQLLTIIISHGNVIFLGGLYAFGVVWSFAMNGLATMVLRFKKPGVRKFHVPLNITIRGVEIPVGIGLVTLVLLGIAVVNLFTKSEATIAGIIFSLLLFGIFTISEKISRHRGLHRANLDEFNLISGEEVSLKMLGCRPDNILVPVSHSHSLYHLAAVLDRVKPDRRDVIVLHIRVLQRTPSGAIEFEPEYIFGNIEQELFSKVLSLAEKRGKRVHLAVIAANDIWDGILRAAKNLQSSTIVLGRSPRISIAEESRQLGFAWERLPDPRPRFQLEIFKAGGEREFYLLGPHAPHLTANEVNSIHHLWLRLSDHLTSEEFHHHDVVNFALNEMTKELDADKKEEVYARLKEYLKKTYPPPSRIRAVVSEAKSVVSEAKAVVTEAKDTILKLGQK